MKPSRRLPAAASSVIMICQQKQPLPINQPINVFISSVKLDILKWEAMGTDSSVEICGNSHKDLMYLALFGLIFCACFQQM